MGNLDLWFFEKNTDRTCTFIWYFGVVVKLIFGSSLHLYEEKEECFFFAFLKSWFFEGDYALRHESKYGLLHTISGGELLLERKRRSKVGKESHVHQLRTTFFGPCQHSILYAHLSEEDMNSFKLLTHEGENLGQVQQQQNFQSKFWHLILGKTKLTYLTFEDHKNFKTKVLIRRFIFHNKILISNLKHVRNPKS